MKRMTIALALTMTLIATVSGCGLLFDLYSYGLSTSDDSQSVTAGGTTGDPSPPPSGGGASPPDSNAPSASQPATTGDPSPSGGGTDTQTPPSVDGTDTQTPPASPPPSSSDPSPPPPSSDPPPASPPPSPDGYQPPPGFTQPPVGINIGQTAPNFTLKLKGGGSVTLWDLRGKPVLLNIAATWCGPCLMELPDIQKIHNTYGTQATVLIVDGGEGEATVDAYFNKQGYTFAVAYDPDWSIDADYKIEFIPQTWIIDANGVITEYVPGSSNYRTFSAALDKVVG
jgi:peroxiredoxin